MESPLIKQKVLEIIAQHIAHKNIPVHLNSHFRDDLMFDSLGIFNLLSIIQSDFNVQIPIENLADLTTVGKLITEIERLVSHSDS